MRLGCKVGGASTAAEWAGNYRVAYQIDNGRLVILVVKIAHRREIHRSL